MDLIRAWRDIDSESIHLRIHGRHAVGLVLLDPTSFDQRELVVRSIRAAEALRHKGDFTEAELITTCYKVFENTDRKCLGSKAVGVNQSCVWASKGSHHWDAVQRATVALCVGSRGMALTGS